MRPRSLRFLFVCLAAALVLVAGACDAIFGITRGTPLGGAGGATGNGGATTSASSGTTSTGGSGGGAAQATGRLAVSTARACVIDDVGNVYCWGDNDEGQLLVTDTDEVLIEAQKIPGVANAKQISLGFYGQQCVTTTDQKVICWGDNQYGELGFPSGDTGAPGTVPGVSDAIEVAAGARCTCVLLTGGTVKCWGLEESGCFGDDPVGNNLSGGHAAPTPIVGLTGIVQLRGGGYQIPWCARLSSGHVSCWSPNFKPTEIAGVGDATDIAVGFGFLFIQSEAMGVVWSVQNQANTGWTTPAVLRPPGTVGSMSAGYNFVGVGSDGGVVEADINNGAPLPAPMPITGQPAGTVAEVGAGYGESNDLQCLRLSGVPFASSVYCWGDDFYGALGANAPELLRTPVPASLQGAVVSSLTTAEQSTLAVLTNGTVYYWGNSGALGQSPTPTIYNDLGGNNVEVDANDYDNDAYVIQKSGPPMLVQGGMAETRLLGYTPDDFTFVRDCDQFDVGLQGGALVVYADQTDADTAGIFGNGMAGATVATAGDNYPVPTLSGVTAFAAYGDADYADPAHVCVIVAGAVSCWGSNDYGEIGSGNPGSGVTVDSPAAVSIAGETIVSIAVGRDFSCAAAMSGKVYCWGDNSFGQLGDGSDLPSPVPVPITFASGPALGVTAREHHACAWLGDTNKTVWCWGANESGQLGDGTLTMRTSPVQVVGLTGATRVSANLDHTCALLAGGSVSCWGSSYYGQAGNGVTGEFVQPLQVLGL